MESVFAYLTYLIISIWLTIKVGNNLHKNGRAWIKDLIGEKPISDQINDLLLLGYRLINLGYIILTILVSEPSSKEMYHIMEFLSVKLGVILLILTWLHYQNIFSIILLSTLKSKYKWQI